MCVNGRRQLQDLGSGSNQLLVLMLLLLDRPPTVVGQDLTLLVAPVLADHDERRQEYRFE